MTRIIIVFGAALIIFSVVMMILFMVFAKIPAKKKPKMTNNEYENYPQD